MKTIKKEIKIVNKNISLTNSFVTYSINNVITKKDENDKSFDFTLFYTKFSEIYPNKEKPDTLFLE
jgi:hypothetical protein